ncbi:MAG: DNA repair and recombination protein RadA [Candidatus Diapherotrites archaeon ADurb.Bin253]|nr:MAG: DNA repair and recombination protein RadA [Candidatus Diapherotrites archaeon ADurb.Bin253]
MAKNKEEKKSFAELAAELDKKFSGNTNTEHFDLSTGSLSLDLALGGGVRSGRITELIAWEGAGKTTICLHLIAEAQKKGLNVAYIDAEHALDEKYAKAIGVDWEKLKPTLFQPMNGEDAFQYGQELLKTGELQLLIFDSTSGMLPKSQMEAEPGGSNMGKHALLFSKEVPKVNIFAANNNAIVVFVSQLREKIGVMFGSPETTQAGNTLKFFASNRIDLRRSLEKEGDEVIGINTKFKILKCKTSAPYKTGIIPILFGVGIDKVSEIIEMATDLDLIKKWGKTITILDGSETKYDLEEFKTLLKDNEEFFQDLRNKIIKTVKNNENNS